jgi:hypothetical protein
MPRLVAELHAQFAESAKLEQVIKAKAIKPRKLAASGWVHGRVYGRTRAGENCERQRRSP